MDGRRLCSPCHRSGLAYGSQCASSATSSLRRSPRSSLFADTSTRRLIQSDIDQVPVGTFSWTSFLLSSVVFGAFHGRLWLPGTVAGLAFGYALYRRRSLGDAGPRPCNHEWADRVLRVRHRSLVGVVVGVRRVYETDCLRRGVSDGVGLSLDRCDGGSRSGVPEISGGSLSMGLGLLAGGILMLRARFGRR